MRGNIKQTSALLRHCGQVINAASICGVDPNWKHRGILLVKVPLPNHSMQLPSRRTKRAGTFASPLRDSVATTILPRSPISSTSRYLMI
jgi:hypothetical protein